MKRLFLLLYIPLFSQCSDPTKEMNWVSENALCCIKYFDGQTSFVIRLKKSVYDQLSKNQQDSLTPIKTNQQISFQFIYGKEYEAPTFTDMEEFFTQDKQENPHYFLHTPLTYIENNTQHITLKELTALLCTKRVAWYTGAGISAEVVPTMNILEESLGFKGTSRDERILSFISQALQNPQQICNTMNNFTHQCYNGEPTKAHRALANYLQKKEDILFTENLDHLHELTGSKPVRIGNPTSFKELYPEKKLQQIDYIICIGLSYDDRGYLGYYRACNPSGILVAICLEKPKYLGPTDYYLQEDAQEVLPKLLEMGF